MDIEKITIDTPVTEEEISNFFKLADKIGWNNACEHFPNLEFFKPKEEIFSLVNQKIKELRKEYGLTQTELAKVFGMTQKEYWRMEQEGVSINILNLAAIAIFYNVSIDWLSGFHPTRKPFYENQKRTSFNGFCLEDMIKDKKSK